MEVGFLFKCAIGIWLSGALLYVISHYLMEDKHTGGIIAAITGVVGIIFMVFGIDINPDDPPYYWTWDDARIADGLCIAQETVERSPGISSSKTALPEELMTRYTCEATEFWRKTK